LHTCHDERDVLRELLHPVERGDQRDREESFRGHFSTQEEVALEVVRREVVFNLVFDIVGENFFGHVVVDSSSVVKEVGGAHYRGHESWVLTRVSIRRDQSVEGECEELLARELGPLLLLTRLAALCRLANVLPVLLLLPAAHAPPLLALLQPLRLVALGLDQVRSHLPLLLVYSFPPPSPFLGIISIVCVVIVVVTLEVVVVIVGSVLVFLPFIEASNRTAFTPLLLLASLRIWLQGQRWPGCAVLTFALLLLNILPNLLVHSLS